MELKVCDIRVNTITPGAIDTRIIDGRFATKEEADSANLFSQMTARVLLGLLLLVGWHTRSAALLSGILLLTFGSAMALALGVQAPLNLSVFSAAGGALLLAECERFPFSVDEFSLRDPR